MELRKISIFTMVLFVCFFMTGCFSMLTGKRTDTEVRQQFSNNYFSTFNLNPDLGISTSDKLDQETLQETPINLRLFLDDILKEAAGLGVSPEVLEGMVEEFQKRFPMLQLPDSAALDPAVPSIEEEPLEPSPSSDIPSTLLPKSPSTKEGASQSIVTKTDVGNMASLLYLADGFNGYEASFNYTQPATTFPSEFRLIIPGCMDQTITWNGERYEKDPNKYLVIRKSESKWAPNGIALMIRCVADTALVVWPAPQ